MQMLLGKLVAHCQICNIYIYMFYIGIIFLLFYLFYGCSAEIKYVDRLRYNTPKVGK